jgi:hypothetical protein
VILIPKLHFVRGHPKKRGKTPKLIKGGDNNNRAPYFCNPSQRLPLVWVNKNHARNKALLFGRDEPIFNTINAVRVFRFHKYLIRREAMPAHGAFPASAEAVRFLARASFDHD